MTGTDPAVDAAQRAFDRWRSARPPKSAEVIAETAAREALAWAAGVIAQEAREQWMLAAEGIPGAQVTAQRMDVLERVVRGEDHA